MDISLLDKKVDLSPGEWIDDIPNQPGLRLKVRSENFKPYVVATAGLGRRSGKQLNTDDGLVDFSVQSGKPLAEHILVDWDTSNWTGPTALTAGDKPLKYSKETALSVLTADDSFGIGAGMRRAVEWAAAQVADRVAKAAKEAAGN